MAMRRDEASIRRLVLKRYGRDRAVFLYRVEPERGMFSRRFGAPPGHSDLVVMHAGNVAFVELKSAKGSLRRDQRRFRDSVERAGCCYIVVRSPGEFDDLIKRMERET